MVLVEYLEILQTFSSVKMPLPVLHFFQESHRNNSKRMGIGFESKISFLKLSNDLSDLDNHS